ncbi:uncharacterized protein LOC143228320 [Tachypleus tridentatus]|uniref:uncharacterized protein LOC143228320 n=1 Tax=Tachypleus tridentatus TaxID=6853 RepID=UPI003FD34660
MTVYFSTLVFQPPLFSIKVKQTSSPVTYELCDVSKSEEQYIYLFLPKEASRVNSVCDIQLHSEENHSCTQMFSEDLIDAQKEDDHTESYRLQCCAFDRAAFCLRAAAQLSDCTNFNRQIESMLAGFHLQIGEKDCSRYGPETCGASSVSTAAGLIVILLLLKWFLTW